MDEVREPDRQVALLKIKSSSTITKLLAIKEIKNKKKKEPFLKRRIESKLNVLRKNVSLIERWETGEC